MPAARHYTTYTKEEIHKSTAIMANQKTLEGAVYLSKIKFDDNDDSKSYIICKHCEFRTAQIDQHLRKFHSQKIEDYLNQFPDAELVSQNAKDRVSGDKNPAANHGGKFSKFSKNFIHYEGLSDEEIKQNQQDVANKSRETKKANPQNENTKIEYYISRGLSEHDAKIALLERQATFTEEKCKQKFGEELGRYIWEMRQVKWQETMNLKPIEEILDINRRKVPKMIYSGLTKKMESCAGKFYILSVGDGLYKFGITSLPSVEKRYNSISKNSYEILAVYDSDTLAESLMIEKIIGWEFSNNVLGYDEKLKNFGWTEVVRMNESEYEVLKNRVDQICANKNSIKELFETWVLDIYSRD